VLHEISRILNCDVDKQTLAVLVSLCEQGVNPEALAAVVTELRREAASSATQQVTSDSKGNTAIFLSFLAPIFLSLFSPRANVVSIRFFVLLISICFCFADCFSIATTCSD
jgi:mitotic-spindle organizing protein 1